MYIYIYIYIDTLEGGRAGAGGDDGGVGLSTRLSIKLISFELPWRGVLADNPEATHPRPLPCSGLNC